MDPLINAKLQARTIGSHKALQWTLWATLAYEAWRLYTETRGDFANGILFFMERELNPYSLSFITLSFISAFILGRWAGVKIIQEGKSPFWLSLGFAALTAAVLLGCLWLLSAATGRSPDNWWVPVLIAVLQSGLTWAGTGWSIARSRR